MAICVILALEALVGLISVVIFSAMFFAGMWGMSDDPAHDPAAPVGAIEWSAD